MTSNRRHKMHLADEGGQTLTEYSLLVSLLAIAAAIAVPPVGSAIVGLTSAFAAAIGA